MSISIFSGAIAYAEEINLNPIDLNAQPVSADHTFRDVGNHWAANAIYSMTQLGILNGYENSVFKPGNSISREEFAVLLVKSFSVKLSQDQKSTTYTDISPDRWSAIYIESVKDIFPYHQSGEYSLNFEPAKQVSREEFTFALVKALGYSNYQLKNTGSLKDTFKDSNQISLEYYNSIAIASELKLISGQSDSFFAPKALITRAEVSSLLLRAIQFSNEEAASLDKGFQISVPEKTSTGIFDIKGFVPDGYKIIVNGTEIETQAGLVHSRFHLVEEGTYNITIALCGPQEKIYFIRKKIVSQLDSPVISIYSLPNSSSKKNVTVFGKVNQNAGSISEMLINNEKISISSSGEFNKDLYLEEGINKFVFRAIESNGKTTETTKEVRFSPPAPVLKVSSIPESTWNNSLIVTGSVSDPNDQDIEVFLNGERLTLNNQGEFTSALFLNIGENTVIITAQNRYSKISTVVKVVERLFN